LLKASRKALDSYLSKSESRDRVEALLLLSELQWRQGQFKEMEKTALLALPDVLDTHYLADFYLQWAKAQSRMNKTSEALELLPIVRDLGQTPKVREEATYFETELRLGELDGRGEVLAEKLKKEESFFMPLVNLLRGKYWFETGGRDPLPMLKLGFEKIPDEVKFSKYKPDLEGLWDLLVGAAEDTEDQGQFDTILGILGEYHRIYPNTLEYFIGTATLETKRGEALSERAASMERIDPIGAERIRRVANRLFYSAGTTLVYVAEHPGISMELSEDAQWAAANAFYAGQQYAKAAEWYREHYHLRPTANRDSLFREGESLMRGKLYEAQSLDEPSALRAFGEYLMEAGPTSPRAPQVVVFRGRILLELGKPLEAIEVLHPLLREPQFSLDPREPEWGEALLLQGLAYGRIAGGVRAGNMAPETARMQATRLLKEYLERFSKGLDSQQKLSPGILEASFSLSRLATQEKRWAEAGQHLVDMIRYSADIPSSERSDHEASLRRAHFLLGDLYLNQGKDQEAGEAFEKAARKYATSEDRIWGLVGRARALIRIGDEGEARKAVQLAKLTYANNPEMFNESMNGQGRTYWPAALAALEAELEEGITLHGR
jgi:tetratricopeptide (TPR) repeat protein